MKLIKKIKFSNIIFVVLLAYIVKTRGPVLYENSKMEGTTFSNSQVTLLSGEVKSMSELPEKKILVFWASWCPPCRFEISRFNKSISSKDLPKKNIFFVNMGESKLQVKKFLKENDYNFNVIMDQDGSLARVFSVSGTPTVIHAEKFLIKKVSMGISPLGIFSAESFLP